MILQRVKKITSASVVPIFLLVIFYMLKWMEIKMGWDFTHLGVYPLARRGCFGIFAHPMVHSSFSHLVINTPPFLLLSCCLYYFFKNKASYILFSIWIGCGILTFLIGAPGWHIGCSGLIYGLAFFLLLESILQRRKALLYIVIPVFCVYSSLIWNMLPHFAVKGTSWQGHLSGAIAGILCACTDIYLSHHPKR